MINVKKKVFTLIPLIPLIFIGLFTYRSYQKNQANIMGVSSEELGLVGYWKFDEEGYNAAIDSSLGNNHGSLENGASHTGNSREGNGLLLTGGDDRVLIPTSGSINNLESLSVAAWIYPTEGGTIIHKGNSWPARFDVGLSSKGQLYFRSGFSKQPGVWLTNKSLAFNQWSHVAATYSFSSLANDPSLYIDGIQQPITKKQSPDGSIIADTSYLYVGNNHDLLSRTPEFDLNHAFAGKIDLLKIYDRRLSAPEIQAAYGLPSPSPSPSPILTKLPSPTPVATTTPLTPQPSPTSLQSGKPIVNPSVNPNSSTSIQANPGWFKTIKKFFDSLFTR